MDVSIIKRPEDWDFEIPQDLANSIMNLIHVLEIEDMYELGDALDLVDADSRLINDIAQQYEVRNYYLRGGWNTAEQNQ